MPILLKACGAIRPPAYHGCRADPTGRRAWFDLMASSEPDRVRTEAHPAAERHRFGIQLSCRHRDVLSLVGGPDARVACWGARTARSLGQSRTWRPAPRRRATIQRTAW
jgi:hypothetical protein